MAAPKGNRFWEKRSIHGRKKLFATPDLMWQAACEYFAFCEDNPIPSFEMSGGKRVNVPKMRAFTLHDLCSYLDCNTGYFTDFESNLDKKKKKDYDFSLVITRIRETIYAQKFRGAAAGLLNANLISRDLGLADKTETKIPPTVVHHTTNLTADEVRDYDKALEDQY